MSSVHIANLPTTESWLSLWTGNCMSPIEWNCVPVQLRRAIGPTIKPQILSVALGLGLPAPFSPGSPIYPGSS